MTYPQSNIDAMCFRSTTGGVGFVLFDERSG